MEVIFEIDATGKLIQKPNLYLLMAVVIPDEVKNRFCEIDSKIEIKIEDIGRGPQLISKAKLAMNIGKDESLVRAAKIYKDIHPIIIKPTG